MTCFWTDFNIAYRRRPWSLRKFKKITITHDSLTKVPLVKTNCYLSEEWYDCANWYCTAHKSRGMARIIAAKIMNLFKHKIFYCFFIIAFLFGLYLTLRMTSFLRRYSRVRTLVGLENKGSTFNADINLWKTVNDMPLVAKEFFRWIFG